MENPPLRYNNINNNTTTTKPHLFFLLLSTHALVLLLTLLALILQTLRLRRAGGRGGHYGSGVGRAAGEELLVVGIIFGHLDHTPQKFPRQLLPVVTRKRVNHHVPRAALLQPLLQVAPADGVRFHVEFGFPLGRDHARHVLDGVLAGEPDEGQGEGGEGCLGH